MKNLVVLGLFVFLVSTSGFGQEKEKKKPVQKELTLKDQKELSKKAKRAPTGANFYIGPVEGRNGVFSVLLMDAEGNSVSGTFTRKQVEVFEAVLEASKAFALSSEKVGSEVPIITRLMEQHEWSLFVDVSKIGDESRLYVSLVTPGGKLTMEAGEINRSSTKPPAALLLKILSQVHEARVANPTQ
jgi:hypothetical protein